MFWLRAILRSMGRWGVAPVVPGPAVRFMFRLFGVPLPVFLIVRVFSHGSLLFVQYPCAVRFPAD